MSFGDNRDTIYKTSYADDAGTGALTNYLGHDQQAVRDRTGREMSTKDLEAFNNKAAGKRNRHIIISPRDHAELSDKELDRGTRRYMSEVIEERPTADYVYSVHDDKENGKDVHIAMTANDETDLEMYPPDIERERERAHEVYQEHTRERTRDHDHDWNKKPRERSLTERLREQSKESVKDQADEFAKNWERQRHEDRLAAMDGTRRQHNARRSKNFEDMRQRDYHERFGRDHPEEQHHSKNFMDMRENARREKLREAQRRHAEQQRKRREQERDQENEQQFENERGF